MFPLIPAPDNGASVGYKLSSLEDQSLLFGRDAARFQIQSISQPVTILISRFPPTREGAKEARRSTHPSLANIICLMWKTFFGSSSISLQSITVFFPVSVLTKTLNSETGTVGTEGTSGTEGTGTGSATAGTAFVVQCWPRADQSCSLTLTCLNLFRRASRRTYPVRIFCTNTLIVVA